MAMSASGQYQPLSVSPSERLLSAYSVEKLCFEMSADFICDLSGIAYSMYEGVAEVA